MRTKEEINRQIQQDHERLFVILRNARIALVADENVAGVHIGAADNYRIKFPAAFVDLHCPGRAAGGMTGSQPSDQLRFTELDNIAIVQQPIHFGRGMARLGAFHPGGIGFHHHQLGASLFFNLADSAGVVVVGVADENDFRVTVIEAELLNAFANQRQILREIAVDEDIPSRGLDQVDGEVSGADVIEVAGDFETWEFVVPLSVLAKGARSCQRDQKGKEHQ
jgi:hypothetical protein